MGGNVIGCASIASTICNASLSRQRACLARRMLCRCSIPASRPNPIRHPTRLLRFVGTWVRVNAHTLRNLGLLRVHQPAAWTGETKVQPEGRTRRQQRQRTPPQAQLRKLTKFCRRTVCRGRPDRYVGRRWKAWNMVSTRPATTRSAHKRARTTPTFAAACSQRRSSAVTGRVSGTCQRPSGGLAQTVI